MSAAARLGAMLSPDFISIGIDCASARKGFTFAALDHDLKLIALEEAELDDVAAFVDGSVRAMVAVNAPSHTNAGVIRKRLEAQGVAPASIRGADLRLAEFDLHGRGIQVGSTPRTESLCPAWVQLGFSLYRRLSKLGYKAFPDEQAARQYLETHPHAAYCSLLGQIPLPKPTLEGRLQRALAIYERGVRIRDPMNFLEEITRHKLLHGALPTELLQSTEQLDALVAAYTAWLAASRPSELTQLGNRQEGYVTLPIAELKEKY